MESFNKKFFSADGYRTDKEELLGGRKQNNKEEEQERSGIFPGNNSYTRKTENTDTNKGKVLHHEKVHWWYTTRG